jgi:hypothetical protein
MSTTLISKVEEECGGIEKSTVIGKGRVASGYF